MKTSYFIAAFSFGLSLAFNMVLLALAFVLSVTRSEAPFLSKFLELVGLIPGLVAVSVVGQGHDAPQVFAGLFASLAFYWLVFWLAITMVARRGKTHQP